MLHNKHPKISISDFSSELIPTSEMIYINRQPSSRTVFDATIKNKYANGPNFFKERSVFDARSGILSPGKINVELLLEDLNPGNKCDYEWDTNMIETPDNYRATKQNKVDSGILV